MKPTAFALASCLALGFSSGGWANDLKAEQRFTDTVVGFDLKGAYSNLTLTIAGPNDFSAQEFSKSSAPSIDLRKFDPLPDGSYIYQLTAATDEMVRINTPPDNNGREGRPAVEALKSVAVSGSFRIDKGVIVKPGPAPAGNRDPQ